MSTELQRKLESMDAKSAYELGLDHHEKKERKEAILCWEKAAYQMVDAAYNLVQVCDQSGDRERFLKWLEVLADTHKDPWGMVLYGTLLCGVNHRLWQMAGFSPLPPENREKGLALIAAGMPLPLTGDNGEFQHSDYYAASEAYYRRAGMRSFEGCTSAELEIALAYMQRALDMIRVVAKQNPMAGQMAAAYESSLENISGALANMRKLGM